VKELIKDAIKRIQTGQFQWTPSYNTSEDQNKGCLVNLFSGHGTPDEVRMAIAKEKGFEAAVTQGTVMFAWNDQQKDVKPILKILRRALKMCKDE
jgi:hypothetical protein